MSESQERMCAVVTPSTVDDFLRICAKWEVTATVIGEVNDSGRLTIDWRGEQIVDVPPRTVAHEGPVYDRPMSRPVDLDDLNADDPRRLPRPATGEELRGLLLRMIASPNLCDKTWITEQYDHYVQGNTVLAAPEDAGVIRIDEQTGLGVAVATDGNGRFTRLDPYAGTQLALAEAYRNVASTGARPLAVTNCLNFGSPEDPEVMWQFAEATRGLADGCRALGLPVTGGNVSFYNQTADTAINPTPVIGVLGVIADVAGRTRSGFGSVPEEVLVLLGTTRPDFGGSEWAYAEHHHLGGQPPAVDLDGERALAELLVGAAAEGLLSAAHDLSDGGLGQVLVESCLRGDVGARVELAEDAFVALFAESPGRVLVAVPPMALDPFTALCTANMVPWARIGEVDSARRLGVDGQFSIPLDELRAAFTATLPALFS